MLDDVANPASGQVCGSCRFWRRDRATEGGHAWGQCRRMPPALPEFEPEKLVHVGVWPHTENRDWCGEWQMIDGPAVR